MLLRNFSAAIKTEELRGKDVRLQLNFTMFAAAKKGDFLRRRFNNLCVKRRLFFCCSYALYVRILWLQA